MHITDFHFTLPKSLIAYYPQPQRSCCRLLGLDGITGKLNHLIFTDLISELVSGDLLVFNDTRVIPARLFGHKASGGKLEVLVERALDTHRVLAHVKASKAPKVGTTLILGDDPSNSSAMVRATILARHDSLFELIFDDQRDVLTILNTIGHIPLPPYITRPDNVQDRELYQTVYNKHPGAIAAPTAGLHFDTKMLTALQEKGVEMAFVTLHVGAGTFQPVRVTNIADHLMHAEYAEVPQHVVDAVIACKARGKRVVAVGTTSVRCLESAANACENGLLSTFRGDTRIFIYPGYHYRIVDALITNFHLPESTLIMLVCAFAGYHNVMHAYRQAIAEKYRFFSYGDAMFISRNPMAAKEIF